MVRELVTKRTKVKIFEHDLFAGDLEYRINDEIEKLQNSFKGTTNTNFEVKNVDINGGSGENKRVTILYTYESHEILDDL